MKLTDKLAEIGCRTDDKARRVSNVAPNVRANVSADALEAGVTLEQLDSLNVPVLRYGTQLTIHGSLPEFNPSARPGGYRAVFLNKNGSVGVRYSAVDAEKKRLIARACASSGPWHASATSAGFSIERTFYVRDEDKREEIKAECIAAMRSIPTDLFYGSAYAMALPYGAGYACGAIIGAVPAVDLWRLIERLTGVTSEAAIEHAERIKEEAANARRAQWQAEADARDAERRAEFEAKWAGLVAGLAPLKAEIDAGTVIVRSEFEANTYLLERERGKLFYKRIDSTTECHLSGVRRQAMGGFPFKRALAEGRCFGPLSGG